MKQKFPKGFWLIGLVFILLVGLQPSILVGQLQYDFRFRCPTYQRNAYGELLVEIESLRPVAPTSDEKFDVRMVFDNENYHDNIPAYFELRTTVWIRAGQKTGFAKVLFPECLARFDQVAVTIGKTGGGQNQTWRNEYVYVNQQFQSTLLWITANTGNFNWNHLHLKSGGRTTVPPQTIQNTPPKNLSIPTFHRMPNFRSGGLQNGWNAIKEGTYVDVRKREQLPTTWLEFTNFHLIVVSEKNWKSICREQPETRKAISNWVHEGGKLLLYDVQLEKPSQPDNGLLKTFANSTAETQLLTNPKTWQYNNLLLKWNSEREKYEGAQPQNRIARARIRQYLGRNLERQPTMLSHPVGTGRVFFEQKDLTNYGFNQWGVIFNELLIPASGSMINQQQIRYGVDSYSFGERDRNERIENFFNYTFDIPGVGRPPVNLFRILIFVFVLVIGPVNYVVLRKRRRLNLLLFTVPAFSLLTCIALLTYAILADGFRMHERVESVSYVDQRSQFVSTYSRHQCFGVSIPSGGYEFDKNTLVIPECQSYAQRPIEITDNGDTYTIRGGKIKTRVPHQFVLHKVKQTERQLVIDSIDSGGMGITNQLGGKIQFVLVKDKDQYYFGQDILDGKSTKLGKRTASQGDHQMRSYVQDKREDIEEIYSGYRGFSIARSSRRSLQFHSSRILKRMERSQGALMQIRSIPHAYIAILETNPMVGTCAPDAKIDKELHVVIGIWK